MQDDSNRNTIIFFVAAAAMLILYQVLVMGPAAKQRQLEAAKAPPAAAQAALNAPRVAIPVAVTREAALAASPRFPIATPALRGSVSLKGARIDDLFLTQYRATLPKNSPPVELLRPEGSKDAYFAEVGWAGQNVPGLPGAGTDWTLVEGSTLAPGKPVVLRTTTGQGLVFTRRFEVDDKYMFTVTDTVANLGAMPVTLAPYGSVQRQGLPEELGKNSIVHEGAIGLVDGKEPKLKKYKDWLKKGGGEEMPSTGGWFGITDKYWMAALVPNQTEKVRAQYRVTKTSGLDVYETSVVGPTRTIPPGRQVTETTRLFAGAKTVPVLKGYQDALGITNFKNAVDWGMFWFLTQPLFAFLDFLFSWAGNFGVAILLLTVCVRLLFFPLAQKQYESLTKMKKLQPQMEELKTRYKEDPARQQQEVMALYQREGANPLAGCVPILFQIPVFYALYKVLTVTIEMRHAPFVGWIKDLSERDPTTIWTLFGLFNYDPATVPLIGGFLAGPLHLGVLPLAYGITMWLTTSMSPPAPDPMQQRIMQLMPIMFTFIMAPFAVGLLIYWTWSNVLTILQQYVIMRRFKVDNPIDQIIRRFTGKPKPEDVG